MTAEQLAQIAEASLANAGELISEARLLHDAGAYPRSYSLAVLAAEEFGKCQLATGTLGQSVDDANYWKEWWAVFYGHGPKLTRAVATSLFLTDEFKTKFIALLETAIKQQRREVGFYLDVREGQPTSPRDAIGPEEAAEAIMCFGEVIDVYASAFSETKMAKAYLDAHQGSAPEMRAAIRSRDPERIRDTWESTTGFRPDDAMLAEIMRKLEAT
jgi:AbiV family abortive infection protein